MSPSLGARVAALTLSGVAVAGTVGLTTTPSEAAVTVNGTLLPGRSVILNTPSLVKVCLTNRGPGRTVTARLTGLRTTQVVVASRVCTSVATRGKLAITNVATVNSRSVLGYTVYGSGLPPF